MPGFLLANGLRPLFFALAIAAGVVAGNRSDSFWIGLLAFLVASATGRVIRRLIRGRPGEAAYEAIWPAAAVGFAYLYVDGLGWAKWVAAILAWICAAIAKRAIANAFFPRRRGGLLWYRPEEWGLPGPDDVVPGRWSRKAP